MSEKVPVIIKLSKGVNDALKREASRLEVSKTWIIKNLLRKEAEKILTREEKEHAL